MTDFVIAQVIALVTCAVSCASYLAKSRRSFLKLQLLTNVLYGTQYALLGAFSGVASNVVSVFKYAVFLHDNKKNQESSKLTLLVLLGLSLGVGVCFIDGVHTVVPIITSLLFTFAAWQNSEVRLRAIAVFCCALWVWYNLSVGAYISAAYSLAELLSALVTMIKQMKTNKHN